MCINLNVAFAFHPKFPIKLNSLPQEQQSALTITAQGMI